jgi:hypothetical protein
MDALSESELVATLDHHDNLVRLCAAEQLSFWDFCASYDDFYCTYALDGHESDAAGQALLAKLARRIRPHQYIAENIFSKVCSDADAATDSYRQAGRFGSAEAVNRLKLAAADLPGGEA